VPSPSRAARALGCILECVAVGVDGFEQVLGATLALPEHRERGAQVVLCHRPVERLEADQATAIECLERASRMYLHGLTLRADAKVIREGQRFSEERGARVWEHVERSLRERCNG
jgi:hypothetical protein